MVPPYIKQTVPVDRTATYTWRRTIKEGVSLDVLRAVGPRAQSGLVVHVQQALDQRRRLVRHERRKRNFLRDNSVKE
jgi:hypothetical protein